MQKQHETNQLNKDQLAMRLELEKGMMKWPNHLEFFEMLGILMKDFKQVFNFTL